VDYNHASIHVSRQCELLGLARSTYYFAASEESNENLAIMRLIDQQYLERPFYGSRKIKLWLNKQGHPVNRKRVQRLMRLMGIEAIYQKPRTTIPSLENKVYPYLLRNVTITHCNHIWSTDITYIPMRQGFMYLVAVIDWFSRHVLSWRLSNSLDTSFCLEALEDALTQATPEVFNTDQGAQFTSLEFTSLLASYGIAISMDGRGRALDNVYIERLWRSVKYEDIYLKDYETVDELYQGLTAYFAFYGQTRPHQALRYQTPYEVYHQGSESPR
jgi:putative transposase